MQRFQVAIAWISSSECLLDRIPDMEKVKKFTLAELLGFIISAKKCMILDMSKAMEKCEIHI